MRPAVLIAVAVLGVAAPGRGEDDPPPVGWHATATAADFRTLRGVWFKPDKGDEPGVVLVFTADTPDRLAVTQVSRPRPGLPDTVADTAQYRLAAPGRMVVIRGDSAAEVRYTIEGATLALVGEFPPVPGDDRRVRFTGTYYKRK